MDDSSRRHVEGEWYTSALVLRRVKRWDSGIVNDREYVDDETRKYLDANSTGNLYEFVCGVPTGWVPEYDVWNKEGRLVATGWRTILRKLVDRKLVSVEKARSVFSASLLECDYDRTPFEKRRHFREKVR